MSSEFDHDLAIQAAIRPIGGVMAEIGWHTTLGSLTEEQVKRLIETSAMQYQAERYGLKFPGQVPF